MIGEVLALSVLAVLLAWPVPVVLARAAWPRRDPVVALLCWQAVGLAGGLSLIGAPLVYGLGPWGTWLPGAAAAFVTEPFLGGVGADRWVALALAAVIATRLVWVLIASGVQVTRAQVRHRARLEVVTQPGHDDLVNVVDVADMVVFCLPGGPPMIVVSAGLMAQLDRDELAAVVAHEQAHLGERHHLFLLPFVAWHRALPMLPATRRATVAVHDLIEMRADDRAAAVTSRRALARAIARVGAHVAVPSGALGANGGVTAERVQRLLEPAQPLPIHERAAALGSAIVVLVGPTVLLFAP